MHLPFLCWGVVKHSFIHSMFEVLDILDVLIQNSEVNKSRYIKRHQDKPEDKLLITERSHPLANTNQHVMGAYSRLVSVAGRLLSRL